MDNSLLRGVNIEGSTERHAITITFCFSFSSGAGVNLVFFFTEFAAGSCF